MASDIAPTVSQPNLQDVQVVLERWEAKNALQIEEAANNIAIADEIIADASAVEARHGAAAVMETLRDFVDLIGTYHLSRRLVDEVREPIAKLYGSQGETGLLNKHDLSMVIYAPDIMEFFADRVKQPRAKDPPYRRHRSPFSHHAYTGGFVLNVTGPTYGGSIKLGMSQLYWLENHEVNPTVLEASGWIVTIKGIADSVRDNGAQLLVSRRELTQELRGERLSADASEEDELVVGGRQMSDRSGNCGTCTKYTCRHRSFKDESYTITVAEAKKLVRDSISTPVDLR